MSLNRPDGYCQISDRQGSTFFFSLPLWEGTNCYCRRWCCEAWYPVRGLVSDVAYLDGSFWVWRWGHLGRMWPLLLVGVFWMCFVTTRSSPPMKSFPLSMQAWGGSGTVGLMSTFFEVEGISEVEATYLSPVLFVGLFWTYSMWVSFSSVSLSICSWASNNFSSRSMIFTSVTNHFFFFFLNIHKWIFTVARLLVAQPTQHLRSITGTWYSELHLTQRNININVQWNTYQ
jgi:hypothetical protein